MRPITLFVCGDVMTGRGIDQILPWSSSPVLFEPSVRDAREYVTLAEQRNGPIPRRVNDEYIWGDAWTELERVAPDVRIINLETSVTRSDDALPWKGIHYRMHPNNVGCLVAAKIDVCVLANNHVLDWGEAGLIETLDVIEAANMRVAGAGRTAAFAERPAVVPLPVPDGRVLVFGLGHSSSGIPSSWAATSTRPGIWFFGDLSEDTAEAIGARVRQVKRTGDVVVASIHWGSNWGYEVPDSHVQLAHALVEKGVDLVHGHSSHHVRPIEVYHGRLILYGCGDLLNDYEGITGNEEYRGDLGIMYFPELHDGREAGELRTLRMVPMQMRRMRLERASPADAMWLADLLERVSEPYGTRLLSSTDGRLVLTLAPGPLRP